MPLNKEIFRAYDIRGLYPEQLDENMAELIGKAIGSRFKKLKYKNVVVGCDDRPSSGALSNSLISGLLSTGCNVTFTGVTVQPAIHYFTFLPEVDAAINITASHNPQQYNGVKIDLKKAVPFYGQDLSELFNEISIAKFASGAGNYKEEDLNPKYIDFVSSKFKLSKPIKVVVYCGNGATSDIYPKILENIGAAVVPIRCYLDPAFPRGVPDPESTKFYPELTEEVLRSHAQIGVGFDGDGDRVGDVDEKGRAYKTDQILLLFIREVLKKRPGETVLFDVKSSQLVEKYIKEHGGIPQMLRTGRAYFLELMYAKKAILGAELSGHMYFNDEYPGFDDGIYATCRLLRIMDDTGRKLSDLMSEFPETVATPEIKVACADKRKFDVVRSLLKEVKGSKEFFDIIEIDGVRAKVSETGWFLVRASNTGAYLSVRIEGKDNDEVVKILNFLAKLLAKYDAILKI